MEGFTWQPALSPHDKSLQLKGAMASFAFRVFLHSVQVHMSEKVVHSTHINNGLRGFYVKVLKSAFKLHFTGCHAFLQKTHKLHKKLFHSQQKFI
jgi:hypothetical protein